MVGGGEGRQRKGTAREPGTYPRLGGPTMRAHAHATVPLHPLSSNVSPLSSGNGDRQRDSERGDPAIPMKI